MPIVSSDPLRPLFRALKKGAHHRDWLQQPYIELMGCKLHFGHLGKGEALRWAVKATQNITYELA